MATSKKFSELPAASSVGNGDLFAIAHEDALAETGYVSQKLTAAQAGQKVNGDTEYPTSLPSFPANGQNPFAALEKLNNDIIGLYPVSTASASIATFTTSLALPLVACKAEIVAQQASGTPTPSNPLPITGVSSVSLYKRESVNIFDKASEGIITSKFLNSDGTERESGSYFISDYMLIKGNFTLTISGGTVSGTSPSICFYDKDKNYISGVTHSGHSFPYTYTTPVNAVYCRETIYNNDINTIQIQIGSTATAYEAYTPLAETKTIALPETIYGGVLDAKNGKLMITHQTIKLKGYDWTKAIGQTNPNGTIYRADNISPLLPFVGWTVGGSDDTLCDCLDKSASGSVATSLNNTFWWTTARDGLRIIYGEASGGSSLSDLTTFLNNSDPIVLGKLATPIEIDLTSANFTTIVGEQNIFADCGDISVSFKQGIQEYIDAKIAETQALIL